MSILAATLRVVTLHFSLFLLLFQLPRYVYALFLSVVWGDQSVRATFRNHNSLKPDILASRKEGMTAKKPPSFTALREL